jgi:hypothetical protein
MWSFDAGRAARNFMVVGASGARKALLMQQILADFRARASHSQVDAGSGAPEGPVLKDERPAQGDAK